MQSELFPLIGKKTYVMGILNLTQNSFSGDGLLKKEHPLSAALAQAEKFITDGADLLDLGAESTRPGAKEVSAQEELSVLLPVLSALKKAGVTIPISIDTYKSEVAEACLAQGARMINDVWGFKKDPAMAAVIARYQASAVLMHNVQKKIQTQKTELGGRYVGVQFKNILKTVKKGLSESIALAKAAGIADERLLIDPGIGFGKTTEHNLELLKKLDDLCDLGYPILLGISRKSFIGYTLDLPPEDRLEGSLAANAYGILHGAGIVRVHDVRQTVRLARMLDAIRNA
ncbi:MAG: dihydropteroate synthase [Anaerolineaceae bacterium]|nr:dihydropteroate synthase [Anaerolineaceae bacterium]